MSESDRLQYGHLHPHADNITIRMRKGQNIAGFPIGILYIDDVYYPMVPGNVVNGWTYSYPVRLKAVAGLTIERLFAAEAGIYDDLLLAANELEKEGVRAITAACGFFGNFQKEMAAAMHVPVAMSSLIQIPWIQMLIGPDKKIGVLTADASSLTDHLLSSCGTTSKGLVIQDLRHAPHFSCILEGRGEFDNGEVRKEVTAAAADLIASDPDVAAILLECSDMPPYASDVQRVTGLPVFDFITMINWLEQSVAQKPYTGFV